ncbi:hypothetical protein BH10CHL1_BH10CHL1_13200 [soil metagenome]
MYSNFSGRGRNVLSNWWSSLSQYQKIIVAVVGLLLLYELYIVLGRGGLNIPWLLAGAVIIFIAFPVHEFAHAATAVALGDETPRLQGRYTLNPLAHIDPMGAILILLVGFGWAKPVQWNPNRITIDRRLGAILVAMAGPLSNLGLAILGFILLRFNPSGGFVFDFLRNFIVINVSLFVFNLIPVPPLDGSHVLFALLPGDTYKLRAQLSQYGFLILFAVLFLARNIISVPVQWILSTLSRIFLL